MLKPNTEKSLKNTELINQAFNKEVGENHNYDVVYGYYVKSGIFSKKISSYVIGYSKTDFNFIIISLDSNVNPIEKIELKKDEIQSIKYGIQGDITIKNSQTSKPIKLFVAPFIPSILQSAYILPIEQTEKEAIFRKFIKENF